MTGSFSGVATALVTPFSENGVNLDTLEKLLAYQAEGGTDAVVVLGTTGEPCTMTEAEKEETVVFARAHKGAMKLIVGTGGNCTARAAEATRRAEELGADGILAVTPYYNKCTQAGLVAYYRAIAGATALPVIVYNVPARTGVNLLPETMERIAEIPNIAGIKEASGNMAQIMETARLIRGKCDLYAGDDGLMLPILCAGGRAAVSVLSNLVPAAVKRLTVLIERGELAAANALADRLAPLVAACFSEVNPIPVKAGLNLLGFDAGEPRAPLTPIEPKHRALLREAMEGFGLHTV